MNRHPRYEIIELLRQVPATSAWGVAIKTALSNDKGGSLILQLQDEANQNPPAMCSILGQELLKKLQEYKRANKFRDMTGRRFGKLMVEKEFGRHGSQILWLCQCDCGGTRVSRTAYLNEGRYDSCGCLPKKYHRSQFGLKVKNPLYLIWRSIKMRTKPGPHQAESYRRKSISLCERWKKFENFYEDMREGYRKGLSVERIDNFGNYEPSNCKWATSKEQNRNKESNRYFTIDGERKPLSEWCERFSIRYGLVHGRLKKGFSIQEALTFKIRQRRQLSVPNNLIK